MRKYSIMVARFPGMNQEHPLATDYVINLQEKLLTDDRIDKIIPWKLSDTPITMSRNRCVQDALKQKADYILMIDADMNPDCEPGAPKFWDMAWFAAMERRVHEEAARVRWAKEGKTQSEVIEDSRLHFPYATWAAPYCGPPPVEHVYVFRWAGKETGAADQSFKLEMFDRDHAATKRGIEEVAALPTGLILYDTRLFSVLPPPWYDYEWADEPYRTQKASTEDVFQTRNASLMGLPQFVVWDSWAGHVKQKVVGKPAPLTVHAMRKEFGDAILRYRKQTTPA